MISILLNQFTAVRPTSNRVERHAPLVAGNRRLGDEARLTVMPSTTPAFAGTSPSQAARPGLAFPPARGRLAEQITRCRRQASACGQLAPNGASIPASAPRPFSQSKSRMALDCASGTLTGSAQPGTIEPDEEPNVKLPMCLFSAAALLLLATLFTGCLTVETYRVTGGVGKVQQDLEESTANDPASPAAAANGSSGTLVPTASVSGSVGTVQVVSGDNTQAADKATEAGTAAATARDVQVTPGGSVPLQPIK